MRLYPLAIALLIGISATPNDIMPKAAAGDIYMIGGYYPYYTAPTRNYLYVSDWYNSGTASEYMVDRYGQTWTVTEATWKYKHGFAYTGRTWANSAWTYQDLCGTTSWYLDGDYYRGSHLCACGVRLTCSYRWRY